ncbi:MAG TPA: VOC family protein [Devosia sp.]|nr:VOC family protein [Devosia sp.]
MPQTLTPCLWVPDIEAAATYYGDVFRSKGAVTARFPDGRPLTGHVEILGTTFMILGDQTEFRPNESVSFMISCKDQAEVDYYWNRFVGDGGEESMCGWCKDRFGFSWQVVPEKALFSTTQGPDPAGRARAIAAMMKMRKLIVADLERAYAGK